MRQNRTRLIVVATLMTTAALLAAFPTASAEATDATLRIDVTDAQRATAQVEQRWIGKDAASMRQSLDVFFGAGDGTLTEEEVERIRNASQADMVAGSIPFILFDGQPVRVVNATIQMQGAPGSARATEAMSMTHLIELELASANETTEHTLTVRPIWNGELIVNAPPGWQVISATGLANSTGAAASSGRMSDGQEIQMRFSTTGGDAGANGTAGANAGANATADANATAPADGNGGAGAPAEQNTQPEQPQETAEPGRRPSSIPGPNLLIVAAGVALAALGFSLRRRAGDGRR